MLLIHEFPDVVFRPECAEDEPFLLNLYASTRALELSLVDWDEIQKQSFIRQQYQAQHQYYLDYYIGSEFLIIEKGGTPIGRLYLHPGKEEIRIVDITLIPEVRSLGIGSAILKELQDQAQAQQLNLGIHVERFNPALRLYQRLGFEMMEDKGVYLFMLWKGIREK